MEKLRRNKLLVISFIAFVMLGKFSVSQSYSYLGHRFLLNASVLAGSSDFVQPDGIIKRDMLFLRGTFSFGCILSRRYLLLANVSHFKNDADYATLEYAPMRGSGLGLSLRHYFFKTAGSVAPVGKFMELDVSVNNVKMEFWEDGKNKLGVKVQEPYFNSGNATLLHLGLGVGANYIVWKRMLLGLGVKLLIIPPIFIENNSSELTTATSLKVRYWNCNGLQGYYSIGYLF